MKVILERTVARIRIIVVRCKVLDGVDNFLDSMNSMTGIASAALQKGYLIRVQKF